MRSCFMACQVALLSTILLAGSSQQALAQSTSPPKTPAQSGSVSSVQEAARVSSKTPIKTSSPYELRFEDFVTGQADVGDQIPAGQGGGDSSGSSSLKSIAGARPVSHEVDLADAIELYTKRISAGNPSPSDLTILGRLLLRQAKEEDRLIAYQLSEKSLRRALEIAPSLAAARLALAQTLMASHQFEEALTMIRSLSDEGLDSAAIQAALFDANLELGNYAEAEAALSALQKREDSPPVLARAARIAELKGDRDRACRLLEQAIQDLDDTSAIATSKVWYLWRLGTIQFQKGELEESSRSFDTALELDPEDEACLVGAAQTAFAGQDLDQAYKYLSQAAAGGAPPVLSLLGDLVALQGEDARASELWEQTEEVMREEAKVAKVAHAREVALFLADHHRNLDEAQQLAEIDFSQRQDPFAWDCRAWVACRRGELTDASKSIDQALRLAPDSPQILFHAAVIASKQGHANLAQRYTDRLVELNPRFSITHHRELQSLLGQL